MVYGTLCGLMLDHKYRLEQYIGDSDGTALFNTHLSDGRSAIARVIASDAPDAPLLRTSWSLAEGLAHANLIRIYASGDGDLDGDPGIYAITERPDDRLSDIIPARPLTAEEAREVLQSIVPCLEYLHRNGVAHGGVGPASIVAMGDSVKLMADTLTSSGAQGLGPFGGSTSRDISALGFLVIEMLTGRRPANRGEAEQMIANADLPAPFHEIALGCTRDERFGRWSLQPVLSALHPPAVVQAPTLAAVIEPASKPRPFTTGLIAAIAGAALMVLFVGYRMQSSAPKAATPERTSASRTADTPAVFPPAPPAKAGVVEKPSPMPQPRPPQRGGATTDWAVVAAIYKNYDAAETRANVLGSKWHRGKLQVYPEKGTGNQYMVVVASALTRDEAEKVQRQAKAAGLPNDTYVTRLR